MKDKKSITRRIISSIVAIVAIIGTVMACMSCVCCLVRPDAMPALQFFGIAFWPILAFNAIMMVALTILRSKKSFISILALLISLPGLFKSYSFGNEIDEDGIKVMSYNVHIFQDISDKRKAKAFVDDIVEMIRKESPDVLCFQEFSSYISQKSRVYCINKFAADVGYKHIYYNDRNNNLGRNVIFSNYPMKALSSNLSSNEGNVNGIMVEVDAGEKGKFAVADVHLLSFKITDKELNELLKKNDNIDVSKQAGKSLYLKMNYAFKQRSADVADMLSVMSKEKMPMIVCGDFNDTPTSYVCQTMIKAGFDDAFIKSGRGAGSTYLGRIPWLRIDYFWINTLINSLSYKRIEFNGSDHYPIMMKFLVNNNGM